MFELNQQGAVWVLRGDQPIHAESIPELQELAETCAEQGQPRWVLDLQNVPLIDSAGLEWLWDMHKRFHSHGGTLEIAAPTPLCREILVATRVADHFVIFDDVVTAVGSFAQ